MDVYMYYCQDSWNVRFEWGPEGIEALGPTSDVIVIVDVFSFTTSVEVAVSRGAGVFPFYHGLPYESAESFAQEKNALVATRTRFAPEGFSLSPASLLHIKSGERLVLPSRNGSTLTLQAASHAHTVAGCLRNAQAVARHARLYGRTVAVIACGERWTTGNSLRPALEDLVGAGSILSQLGGSPSPEAEIAIAAYESASERLPDILRDCGSGIELEQRGFAEDVALASELNVSSCVPVLKDGLYCGSSP
jgi:2-phosphosulfolactate phosphatase